MHNLYIYIVYYVIFKSTNPNYLIPIFILTVSNNKYIKSLEINCNIKFVIEFNNKK